MYCTYAYVHRRDESSGVIRRVWICFSRMGGDEETIAMKIIIIFCYIITYRLIIAYSHYIQIIIIVLVIIVKTIVIIVVVTVYAPRRKFITTNYHPPWLQMCVRFHNLCANVTLNKVHNSSDYCAPRFRWEGPWKVEKINNLIYIYRYIYLLFIFKQYI